MARNSTADRPTWAEVRTTWENTGANFSEVFIKLNWGRPTIAGFEIDTKDGGHCGVRPVASLKNFHAFEIEVSPTAENSLFRNVQREISKLYPDNILIAKDTSGVRIEWPRRKPDGGIKYDSFITEIASPHQLTCQKLAGAGFEISELSRTSLEDVRSRIYGLSSEAVTKRFYERFRDEHDLLAKSIESSSDLSDEQRHSYSSLLLNRLMFVYFLQKKEFLSGDVHRLNNVLVKCTEGSANYYRDALLPLFFEGFNGQIPRFDSDLLNEWWGAIPYINGGIFAPHGLELESELVIPNSSFARVFEFFEMFDWHLDARPIGTPNEINPEVLGYIFEQYINYTADGKKESGAYYTPEDVTGYMVAQTLVPRVLDEFIKIWPTCLDLVKLNPTEYVHPSLFHGATSTAPLVWEETEAMLESVWQADPIGWHVLDDAETRPEICLPGETWVETFYRRERVEHLLSSLESEGVQEVNDIITLNLNGPKLVSDIISSLGETHTLIIAWDAISKLSVIDPTCGSGAFLFAALTTLESIYEEILDALDDEANLLGDRFTRGNSKYQIRKHIAMRNLYGTDIMADAIETAKLRIFLALAAVLERASEIEPLPDLDFNLKSGNLVVGLYDTTDASRINPEGTFVEFYDFSEVESLSEDFKRKFTEFKDAELQAIENLPSLKEELSSLQGELRTRADDKYLEIAQIDKRDHQDWITRLKPFHWFTEFPEIIARGGFDVVIGNPPYIKKSNLDTDTKRAVSTYRTSNCPDFFAVCYERSLQLVSEAGRHSLVVMLNLAFSDQFNSLREVVGERGGSEWWSTFGKRPDSLFRGVQVCNTVLILAPGKTQYASRHHLFSLTSRKHLFPGIEYFPQVRQGAVAPRRAGLAIEISNQIQSNPPSARGTEGGHIYLRPTGRYWFPVLPVGFPQLSQDREVLENLDGGLNAIFIPRAANTNSAVALLAGKISYLWWSATGDDFHVLSKQAEQVLLHLPTGNFDKLEESAKKVISEGFSHVFGSTNAGKIQLNIRWKSVRGFTDQFDKEFLELIGLGGEWRSLNIWYRQAMKAGKDNANGVDFSRDEIFNLLSAAGHTGIPR